MELIKITKNEKGEQLVSARELHKFLEVKSRFNDWFKNRVRTYELLDGVDFLTVTKNLVSGGQEKDGILKMEVAKELSMVENNEKGKQARRYFINCEKKLKELPVLTEMQMIVKIAENADKNDKRLSIVEDKLDKRMGLTGAQARQIGKLVSDKVYKRAEEIINSNGMNFNVKDAKLSALYSDINTNLKAYYGISIRSDIPQSKYIEACEKIEDWNYSFETEKKFRDKNIEKAVYF